jgi:hypothetical protein
MSDPDPSDPAISWLANTEREFAERDRRRQEMKFKCSKCNS